ncbi:MAG TPA: hypothetical protein VKE92_05395 [Anaerolineales bacterium]|jgi:hypothetical protein|nr:hypothetical protein [Anaerolineales bacterium]
MSRYRLWILRVVTIGIGLTISLVFSEIIVRIVGVNNITQPIASAGDVTGVYEFSRARHHKLVPNARFRHHEVEFDYLWINNSLGMRDRERSLRKGAGNFRILFLGDSMVQGYGVPQEQTMVALLEASLNKPKRERRIEVLNGGIFGYSPFLEYLYLHEIMPLVEPDVVIVGLFLGNDVGDDYFYTQQARLDNNGAVSFEKTNWPWDYKDELLKNGAKSVEIGVQKYPQTWVLKSHLIRLFLRLYERGKTYDQYRDYRRREAELTLQRKDDIRVNLGLVNYPVTTKRQRVKYWEISESYLKDMHRLCQRQQVPLIVTVIPFLEPDTVQFSVFEEPNEILKEFGKQLSIPVVFLITEFRKWPAKQLFFELDGHWNALGNSVAAETMDRELRSLNLLPSVLYN